MQTVTRHAAGALLALVVVVAACSRDASTAGRWATCTCPYLTDYDDVAKHSVDICVPPGRNPLELARDCASRVAHGPAEACTCAALRDPCDGNEPCKSNEYR